MWFRSNQKSNSGNIVATGRQEIMMTAEYKKKVEKIQSDITLRYASQIANEKNFFKRLSLKASRNSEINSEIRKLTSLGNLYLKTGYSGNN